MPDHRYAEADRMICDIVFPNNNEKELIEMAELLGYEGIIFAYKDKIGTRLDSRIKIFTAALCDRKSFHMKKKTADFTIMDARRDIREVLEQIKPDFVFGLEFSGRKDFIHHRNSGLNQVLCKIANKNNVSVIIPLGELKKLESMRKSSVLGRFSQNISFLRKYKVEIKVASFAASPYEMRAPKDITSLGHVLGMDTKQAKECVEYLI